ncbi:lysylphosphatidylglycerol synthase transmembrane domain-containing protein [Methanosarcina horonobensis]|nr:lysylphosphatidylglycerol synthase transmembrane domain-containing protein [Methanosarcina horonobensis]
MKYITGKKFITVLATFLLLGIILSQIRIEDLIATIKNIDKTYLVLGFFLYVLSYLLRGLRFHILLDKKISLTDLFHIVCVHNMVNSILPARSGELSYIYILKKYHDKSTGEGVATLMVARVLDFITISLLFFMSSLFVHDFPETFSSIIWLVVLFTALLAVFLIILLYAGDIFLKFANAVFKTLKLNKHGLVNFFSRKAIEIVDSFKNIKNSGKMIELFIISFTIWITLYFLNYTLIKSLSINIGFFEVLLASTFVVFMSILPIQGMGGFGTYEVGWAIGFVGIGLSKELAINSGIVVHIIGIVYYVLLGFYGYQYLCKK